MTKFAEKYGTWAIVTGATAGIGREFSRQLAEHGLNIVLVARRPALLELRARELREEFGIETLTVSADLSQRDFLGPVREATQFLDVGILVNNAGAGVLGPLVDNDIDAEVDALHLNTRAPLMLSHAYGRDMARRGKGAIVFVSSMVGLMGIPRYAHYAATKAYDLLVAEGLQSELREHGVDVLALVPGFTESDWIARLDLSRVPMPVAKTDAVVATALRQLGHRTVAVPGLLNRILYATIPLFPRRFNTWLMGTILRGLRLKPESDSRNPPARG